MVYIYMDNSIPLTTVHFVWSKRTFSQLTVVLFQVIAVTLQQLSLEEHPAGNCGYDSLSLYDGSSAESPQLAKVCTVAPPTITSSGSSLFVVFKSDTSVNSGRFSLSWTFVSQGSQGWYDHNHCLTDSHSWLVSENFLSTSQSHR